MRKLLLLSLLFNVFVGYAQQNIVKIKELEEDDDYILYKVGNKYGIGTSSDSIIFTSDSIIEVHLEPYLFCRQSDKWGVVGLDGKIIIPMQYDKISTTYYDNNNHIDTFIVMKDDKFGTVGFKGEKIVPIIYDDITNWIEYGPNAHYVMKNGKMGLVAHNGKVIIPPEYDFLFWYPDTDFIEAKKNNNFGILTSQNTIFLPFENDNIIIDLPYFDTSKEGRIAVRKDSVWSYLNLKGEVIRKDIPDAEIRKEYKSGSYYFAKNYNYKENKSFLKIRMAPPPKTPPIDPFYENLMDYILLNVSDSNDYPIEFPKLYSTTIDKFYIDTDDKTIIGQMLINRGFRGGGYGMGGIELGEEKRFSYYKGDCDCEVTKEYILDTDKKGQYSMYESIKCDRRRKYWKDTIPPPLFFDE